MSKVNIKVTKLMLLFKNRKFSIRRMGSMGHQEIMVYILLCGNRALSIRNYCHIMYFILSDELIWEMFNNYVINIVLQLSGCFIFELCGLCKETVYLCLM